MIVRIAVRSAVIAACAVAAAIVLAMGPPSIPAHAPTPVSVDPPPAVVACPGQLKVPVGAVGSGGDLASEPTLREFHVYTATASTPLGEGLSAQAIVGVQVEYVGDGDIAGWAAVSCRGASTDQWLVGGSTAVGASSRLVVSNPGTAPSEVTATFYGPLGKVEQSLVIPVAAGAQADRLIEGVAASLGSLAVHLTATGPGVVAAIQDSRLEGFQPAGTAWIQPSDLAQSLVIPAADAGAVGSQSTVRMMAPDGAKVTLTLISAQGVEPWSIGRALDLEPGVVTDVAIPYAVLGTIEIDADAPVVAAARTVVERQSTEGIAGSIAYDHAWIGGVGSVDRTLMAVTPADQAEVAVYSATTSTVTFVGTDGAVIASVDVPARTVQRVTLPVPAGTQVETSGAAVWAIVMDSGHGDIAAVSPVPVSQQQLSTMVMMRAQ